MTDFTGRWELLGAVSHDPDVTSESVDEIRMDAVIGCTRLDLTLLLHSWLAGETFDAEPPLEPATGLTLDIGDDDTFTESGTAEVEWFCEEGVLEAKALPFDGRIVTTAAGSHLLLHDEDADPHSADDDRYGDVRLRLDDGDTQIADTVVRAGDRLRRTVSVMTDEMYLSRVRYEYGRA
ncbi:hypothetical protein ACFWU3_26465 [Streptomyces sp. NPDC058685]|uniref:hypothetical protein n=1 Tax=Streptomyces sp. NPDC058685 TaxID=3346598 RepID=UPI00366579FA